MKHKLEVFGMFKEWKKEGENETRRIKYFK